MHPYYQDDYITIYNGDCLELLPDISGIDGLITDPPYGIGKHNIVPFVRTERNSKGRITEHFEWDESRQPEGIRLSVYLAKNAIVWGGNYYTDVLPPSRCWLVWDKLNSGNFSDFELAWTSMDKASQMLKYMWNGMIKQQPEDRYHPTQKPVSLMRWCIEQIDYPGLICDPYAGSGSTLIAAKQLGFKAIGIEIHEPYCEIAARRVEQTGVMFPLEMSNGTPAAEQLALLPEAD